jgi:hypothetical protein
MVSTLGELKQLKAEGLDFSAIKASAAFQAVATPNLGKL